MRNILTFILIETVLCHAQTEEFYDDFDGRTRNKRQDIDDRWSWGLVDIETTTNARSPEPAVSSSPSPEPDEPEYCKLNNSHVPDFRAPGKRISEAKCEEYNMWHIAVARNYVCENFYLGTRYLLSRPSANPVPAASGDHITLPGEYPHMVSSLMATTREIDGVLQRVGQKNSGEGAVGWKAAGGGTWIFKCGSSLISPKFLLTAAHCSVTSSGDSTVEDPEPKIVRLGNKNIADMFSNSQLSTDKIILKITKHPEYTAPKRYHDIAVIELVEGIMEFTELIQPACLWSSFDTSSLGFKANITGWGVQQFPQPLDGSGLPLSPELHAAEVDIIDSGVCDQFLLPYCSRLWCGVQDGQICAGDLAGGVDTCNGDSGGPLQVKIPSLEEPGQGGALHYVIGVTSFGIGCGRSNTPSIYMRVSHYIDWIEGIVWT